MYRPKLKLSQAEMTQFIESVKESTHGPGGTWSFKIYEETKDKLLKLHPYDIDRFTQSMVDDFCDKSTSSLCRYKTAQLFAFMKAKNINGFTESIIRRKPDLLNMFVDDQQDQLGSAVHGYISSLFSDSASRPISNTPPPTIYIYPKNTKDRSSPTPPIV